MSKYQSPTGPPPSGPPPPAYGTDGQNSGTHTPISSPQPAHVQSPYNQNVQPYYQTENPYPQNNYPQNNYPQGYYQGNYPPQHGGYYAPGPQMGYAPQGGYGQQGYGYGQQGYYGGPQGQYVQQRQGSSGFGEALLASLACCCCLDACLLF